MRLLSRPLLAAIFGFRRTYDGDVGRAGSEVTVRRLEPPTAQVICPIPAWDNR
jgi:hypothetical protein